LSFFGGGEFEAGQQGYFVDLGGIEHGWMD
jgi:hypothetical protein